MAAAGHTDGAKALMGGPQVPAASPAKGAGRSRASNSDASIASYQCSNTAQVIVALIVGIFVSAVFYRFSSSLSIHSIYGIRAPVLGETAITDKPRNDARSYLAKELANGLEVVAVQDTQSLYASFALAVRAGSFDDPPELPGLMHFIEHMVFLGTAKYPDPEGFDKFVAENGGDQNAYTADEATVYYVELSEEAADEGLDRLADFFRAPLFKSDFVEKEVHAIDSEHAKNVQDPGRRVYEVMNSFADPASPVGRFHTGNLETLYTNPKKKGVSPMAALKRSFAQHYCPARMRLVTFGSKPPHEQLRVAEEAFGKIPTVGALAGDGTPSCSKEPTSYAEPSAWPPKRLHKWVDIEGTTPHSTLWLGFQLPDLSKEYAKQPLDYVLWVLGYKGVGSLFNVLRDVLGLADGLGTSVDGSSVGTTVSLELGLTDLGRDRPDLVLDVVFAYLASLQQQGVNSALHRSIAEAGEVAWQWSPPSDPTSVASDLAERLTRLPFKDLLWGDDIIRQLDDELAMSLLKQLSPSNLRIGFVDPRPLEKGKKRGIVPGTDEIQSLNWYGARYAVRDLDKVFPSASARWSGWAQLQAGGHELEEELKNRLHDLSFPTDTELLPQPPHPIVGLPQESDISLELAAAKLPDVESEEAIAHPSEQKFGFPPERVDPQDQMLGDARLGADVPEIWYRQGWRSNSPKFSPRVSLSILIRPMRPAGSFEVSAADQIRMSVYFDLLAEEIDTPLADLGPLGGSWKMTASTSGISFGFGGLPTALDKTVTQVMGQYSDKASEPTAAKRFGRVVQDLRRSLGSFSNMPVSYAIEDRNLLLTPGEHSREDMLQELNKLTLGPTTHALQDLLLSNPLQLTVLAMGNIDKGKALEVVRSVTNHVPQLSSDSAAARAQRDQLQVEKVTPIVALEKPVELRKRNPRPGDPNDVVVVSIMAGVVTVEMRVVLGILGDLLQRVAFNELRTRMQLGYVVNAGGVQLSNVMAISCVVQGNVLKADDLEAAVYHVYFKVLPDYLDSLSSKELAMITESFADSLLQKPFQTSTEVGHFWSTVATGSDCFHLQDEMLRFLRTSVSKELLKQEWQKLINPSGGVRAKLVVKYFGGEDVPSRPSEENAKKAWEKQGITGSELELLRREYKETLVLHKADASTRAQVLKEAASGKYLATDLHCHLSGKLLPVQTTAGSFMQVQQQEQQQQQQQQQQVRRKQLRPQARVLASGDVQQEEQQEQLQQQQQQQLKQQMQQQLQKEQRHIRQQQRLAMLSTDFETPTSMIAGPVVPGNLANA